MRAASVAFGRSARKGYSVATGLELYPGRTRGFARASSLPTPLSSGGPDPFVVECHLHHGGLKANRRETQTCCEASEASADRARPASRAAVRVPRLSGCVWDESRA